MKSKSVPKVKSQGISIPKKYTKKGNPDQTKKWQRK